MPMSRLCTGRSVMSWPPTWTRPLSGISKPAMMRRLVVLPQPDGPSSEKNSPALMSSVTPSTATTLPSKVLVTSSSLMVAEDSVSALQDFGDARVDVVLAGVVPFPVGLDQGRDLGLRREQLGVVLGVELHLPVGRRVPHALGQQLLHVGPQHVVAI